MAPAMATKRLREELIKLKTEPPPGVIAEPDESNILKWFYVIRGPTETPYEGGVYIGKLIFPSEYPMKGPSIHVLTPSGRFQINTKICMSMSDFHPESWNPMWSVATIIQGVQSFMASDELTTGGLKASEGDRKKFAKLSVPYNKKNYPNLFDGDIEAAFESAHLSCQKAEEKNAKSNSAPNDETPPSSRRSRRTTNNTVSTEQDASKQDTENDGTERGTGTPQKPTSSRRSRRMAKKAESAGQEKGNQETENDVSSKNISNSGTDNQIEQNEPADASTTGTPKELSAAEIEKRRKRNAKKRAKQKAKKAGASNEQAST